MCSGIDKILIRDIIYSQKDEFELNSIIEELKHKSTNITPYDVVNTTRAMHENGVLEYKNGKYRNIKLMA